MPFTHSSPRLRVERKQSLPQRTVRRNCHPIEARAPKAMRCTRQPIGALIAATWLLSVLLLQSCALPLSYRNTKLAQSDADCLAFFDAIDEIVERYGVRDASKARIEGFPNLRIDRFHASLAPQTKWDGRLEQWVERLRKLDQEARRSELANLPAAVRQTLVRQRPTTGFLERDIDRCGKRLNRRLLASNRLSAALLKQARAPDAYQTWKRIVGGYGLARYAAAFAITRLHSKLAASYASEPAALPRKGRVVTFGPPEADPLASKQVNEMIKKAVVDPLGIPLLTSAQITQLFDTFAPIFEIDVVDRNDLIGEINVDRGGRPWVDTGSPRVYRKHAFTRFRGKILLQLVYQIWLPARKKTGAFDFYGGRLDSVIWRVTLDADGRPIAYDSIHACGCYYLLFPARGYRTIPPRDGAEAVLSPKPAPVIGTGSRITIRLEHRTHYIQQIFERPAQTRDQVYEWRPYDDLRSLQAPDGLRYSLFGEHGIVEESRRTEHYFLWPFGVASPGAMRQWGTHAIAFTGRRHFDDAFLLEHLIAPTDIVISNAESALRSPFLQRRGRD